MTHSRDFDRKAFAAALTAASLLTSTPLALAESARRPSPRYNTIVSRVAAMVHDQEAIGLARRHGLSVLNVMWEDTGRFQGSSVGPNISDVTIEVEEAQHCVRRTPSDTSGIAVGPARTSRRPECTPRRTLMPVFRFPNFSDKTADVKLKEFFLRVGNEREGRPLRTISLHEFLAHPTVLRHMETVDAPSSHRLIA